MGRTSNRRGAEEELKHRILVENPIGETTLACTVWETHLQDCYFDQLWTLHKLVEHNEADDGQHEHQDSSEKTLVRASAVHRELTDRPRIDYVDATNTPRQTV
jgi:hypothetical protein